MKVKLTGEQKRQISELKKIIRREKKRTPLGQGDSVNQHLRLTDLSREITKVKSDPNYISQRII